MKRLVVLPVFLLSLLVGSPWENGFNESFNGKLRNERLNTEFFYTLKEAKVLIEARRQHYNQIRPHSSLGDKPPAPRAVITGKADPVYATQRLQPDQAFPQMLSALT